MQPIGLDGLAPFLGPGTGGLWMGEQQRNAMQESELNQQKTLADIARMKQEQEHNAQMNPLRVQHQQGVNARQPVDLEGAVLGNQEKQDKLDKKKYQDFLDDLQKMDPQSVGMADRAGFLNDISKRHNIPVDHPMYELALKAHAQGPQGWEKFRQAFGVSSETQFREGQANARTDRSNDRMEANTKLIQETQERIRLEDREAKIRIAEMRLQEGKKEAQLKNYSMAAIHFRGAAQAAEQAGEVEKARELYAESARMEQLDLAMRQAGANAPGKQPLQVPGMPPRAAPPALPQPGPNVNAMPGVPTQPQGPVQKWGRGPDGKPVRIQ